MSIPKLQNQIASIRNIIREKPHLYETLEINAAVTLIDAKYPIEGDFIYVLSAPLGLVASIKFNSNAAESIPVKRGYRYQIPFAQFFLTNAAVAGSVVFLIGKDLAFDFAELGVVNVDSISQPITLKGVNSFHADDSPIAVDDGTAFGGPVPIAIVNSGRYQVMISNEGPSAVRIGKVGVTFALGGFLLQPNTSYTSSYNGALYAICDAGLLSEVAVVDEYTL